MRALRHPLNSKWVELPESRLHMLRKYFWQLSLRQIPPNVTQRYKWIYYPSELNQCFSGINITPEFLLMHLFIPRFTLYLQNSKILTSVLLAVRLYFQRKVFPQGRRTEKGQCWVENFSHYLGTVWKTQPVYLNFINVTILPKRKNMWSFKFL